MTPTEAAQFEILPRLIRLRQRLKAELDRVELAIGEDLNEDFDNRDMTIAYLEPSHREALAGP
jgi:hypothetical protein